MRYVLAVLAGAALVAAGIGVGFALDEGPGHSAAEKLEAADIGDAVVGRKLFTEYGCVACHSYAGKGGKDAPALDFMRGRMNATEIAEMSGRIWNHVPQMATFFKEEGIDFPTFKEGQMADLIAYMHGGGPAPRMLEAMGEHMDEEGDEDSGHMDR